MSEAITHSNPFIQAAKSAKALAKQCLHFMYGTKERSNMTMFAMMLLLVVAAYISSQEYTALQACAI